MRKHRMNYKKTATAVLAGMMLSLAVAGSAFAATSKPAGPGTAAIKKAEEYLVDDSINKQAKKAISRAIPKVSKVESITLNTMIKIARNWDKEDNFEDLFSEWMKDNTTRKNAFLAIRYSNSKNVENMIIAVPISTELHL